MRKLATFILICLTSSVVVALPPSPLPVRRIPLTDFLKGKIKTTVERLPVEIGRTEAETRELLKPFDLNKALQMTDDEVAAVFDAARLSTGEQTTLIGDQLAMLATLDNSHLFLAPAGSEEDTQLFKVLQTITVADPKKATFEVLHPQQIIKFPNGTLRFQSHAWTWRDSRSNDLYKELTIAANSAKAAIKSGPERKLVFQSELPVLVIKDEKYEFFGNSFSACGKQYIPVLKQLDVVMETGFKSVPKGSFLVGLDRSLEIITPRPHVFRLWHEELAGLLKADELNKFFFSDSFNIVSKSDPTDKRKVAQALRPMVFFPQSEGMGSSMFNSDKGYVFIAEGDLVDLSANRIATFSKKLFDQYEVVQERE